MKRWHAGAVSVAGGVTLLALNVFENNTAGGYGGAVAYQDGCFTVYDTSGMVRMCCQYHQKQARWVAACSQMLRAHLRS